MSDLAHVQNTAVFLSLPAIGVPTVMAAGAHRLQIAPVKPPLPALRRLDWLDVMHLAGNPRAMGLLRLTVIPGILQLGAAECPPGFGAIEF